VPIAVDIRGAAKNFGAVKALKGVEDARTYGIEVLYQDLALCDDLDVAESGSEA
jgi:ABC-type sugar transport system ATPase subunit